MMLVRPLMTSLKMTIKDEYAVSVFSLPLPPFLEKAMGPYSSTLAWKISWMEEPGRLQSMGSLRVGNDWAPSLSLFHFHVLEKEMATYSSVLAWRIPGTGEPGGLTSMESHRVGHDWSDLAVAVAAPSFLYIKTLAPLVVSQGGVGLWTDVYPLSCSVAGIWNKANFPCHQPGLFIGFGAVNSQILTLLV